MTLERETCTLLECDVSGFGGFQLEVEELWFEDSLEWILVAMLSARACSTCDADEAPDFRS